MKLLGDAKFNGVFTYSEETISSLEREFFTYQSMNSLFTVTDLLNLLRAFDRVSSIKTVPEVIQNVVDLLP